MYYSSFSFFPLLLVSIVSQVFFFFFFFVIYYYFPQRCKNSFLHHIQYHILFCFDFCFSRLFWYVVSRKLKPMENCVTHYFYLSFSLYHFEFEPKVFFFFFGFLKLISHCWEWNVVDKLHLLEHWRILDRNGTLNSNFFNEIAIVNL